MSILFFNAKREGTEKKIFEGVEWCYKIQRIEKYYKDQKKIKISPK